MEDRNRQRAEHANQRKRKRAQERKRRQKTLIMRVLICFIIIVGVIAGAVLIKKYSPTKEKADLKAYYGIEEKDQLAVVLNNEVLGMKGVILDGKPYIEYSFVRDYLNDRFYVDYNENLLLYTLPEGTIRAEVGSSEYTLQKEKKNEGYPILRMNGHVAYIALDFIQEYTNIDFRTYEDPNRVVIISDWGETTVAIAKKDTKVRLLGGVKSPILTELSKKDTVTVIEKIDGWTKVRTEDGFVGYVKKGHLKKETKKTVSREFQEQKYSNISKDYTINMAWHVVSNRSANDYVLSMIADTKGLTTISPTWFSVNDTKGNINSFASSQYVNYAHQSNIEVWAAVDDFNGGINSTEQTYELLSRTATREKLINQLIAEALKTGIDGINVDFEMVSEECGAHYIQFIRELSVMCRKNGIILSVDSPVPKSYNTQYNLKEQGVFADYVILMGYDEHYAGSPKSGPVASLSYVKGGIDEALKTVPKEKLINAVPFYTRLWEETPKTEEELEAQAGTEAAEYPMNVTSKAYGMSKAEQIVSDSGAELVVDKATGLNYATWENGGATYKIWLEDLTALEAKLKLMKEYHLAGVAAWRLGFEKSGTWELIEKYVN